MCLSLYILNLKKITLEQKVHKVYSNKEIHTLRQIKNSKVFASLYRLCGKPSDSREQKTLWKVNSGWMDEVQWEGKESREYLDCFEGGASD